MCEISDFLSVPAALQAFSLYSHKNVCPLDHGPNLWSVVTNLNDTSLIQVHTADIFLNPELQRWVIHVAFKSWRTSHDHTCYQSELSLQRNRVTVKDRRRQ